MTVQERAARLLAAVTGQKAARDAIVQQRFEDVKGCGDAAICARARRALDGYTDAIRLVLQAEYDELSASKEVGVSETLAGLRGGTVAQQAIQAGGWIRL